MRMRWRTVPLFHCRTSFLIILPEQFLRKLLLLQEAGNSSPPKAPYSINFFARGNALDGSGRQTVSKGVWNGQREKGKGEKLMRICCREAQRTFSTTAKLMWSKLNRPSFAFRHIDCLLDQSADQMHSPRTFCTQRSPSWRSRSSLLSTAGSSRPW